jgi:hypothetical protein
MLTQEMLDSPYFGVWFCNILLLNFVSAMDLTNATIFSSCVVMLTVLLSIPCTKKQITRPDYLIDTRPNWQIIRERYNMN